MKFEGAVEIKAPREKVWKFLLDPESISKCFPDLQKLEVLEEDKFKAKVKVGVSFIKQDFDFQLSIVDKKPPTHAKLIAHGSGSGSVVDLQTSLDLDEDSSGVTNLKWASDVQLGGLVAGVGSRLVERTAQKQIGQLFECIKKRVAK